MFPVKFLNKGLDHIRLAAILRNDEVINALPECLRKEDPPSIIPSLGATIRNKILNYKQTVVDIDTNNLDTFGTGISECGCSSSPYKDNTHGHVITGDLRFISNKRLRCLISKGPNYREPRSINWKRCYDEIVVGLDVCSGNMARLTKGVSMNDLLAWKEKVLEKVQSKIEHLKSTLTIRKTNPVLKDPEVVAYLENLHKHYVLVPIDKAANNIAIVCKRYYVEVILKEIGIMGEGNSTYCKIEKSAQDIVEENVKESEVFGFNISEKEKCLPSMYWIPKMHKTPISHRFIIASKLCSTKQMSQAVSNVFKLLFNQTQRYHHNAKYFKNYNVFWVLQNAEPVLEKIQDINRKKRAKSVSTYDFSTLYTKIPHDDLIQRLSRVIDQCGEAGKKEYIKVSPKGNASWATKRGKGLCFHLNELKETVELLIRRCFFAVGNTIMQQTIGIPMGIDPAPFWANLFLYTYEQDYMNIQIHNDKVKARHFHGTNRFIDDLIAMNDGGMFAMSYADIYPADLELKVEHSGTHASFLSLDISIADGIFVYKLYDKRDAFPFEIVRMPYLTSNIPKSIFYSALVGEFLRISRSTLLADDFAPKARCLINRMIKQGANIHLIQKHLRKIIERHNDSFIRYSTSVDEILNWVLQSPENS